MQAYSALNIILNINNIIIMFTNLWQQDMNSSIDVASFSSGYWHHTAVWIGNVLILHWWHHTAVWIGNVLILHWWCIHSKTFYYIIGWFMTFAKKNSLPLFHLMKWIAWIKFQIPLHHCNGPLVIALYITGCIIVMDPLVIALYITGICNMIITT